MKVRSTAGLGLTLGLCLGISVVHADDFDWRPTSAPPAVVRAREVIASTQPPAATLGRPVASAARPTAVRQASVKLGAPVDAEPERVTSISPLPPSPRGAGGSPALDTERVTSLSPLPPVPLAPGSRVADPETEQVTYTSSVPLFRGQAPDSVLPPVGGAGAIPAPAVAIPGGDLYSSGAVTPTIGPSGNYFTQGLGYCKESFTRRCGRPFQSDNTGDFGEFCSPVTSPFLAEDPRALTEVKPLFIYQSIPGGNPVTHGGSVEYFGLQARLALTERWSIVLNKFGGVAIQPDDKTFIQDKSGFAEIWIGPKYTFYRDDTNKTAAAVGMTFQIPSGSRDTFQNTGALTLSPYFSFAKGFGKLPQQLGNFNYMSTTGFAFNTGSDRSDYFYSNLHLDFDVLGQHRLYPLIELNWMSYINHGHANPVPFEGGDLFNLGAANLNKKNVASAALGARYKLGGRDAIQFGGAFEFPLTDQKDLNDFRVVFDVIFRY